MTTKLPLLAHQTVVQSQIRRRQLVDAFDVSARTQTAAQKRPITCLKGCDHCCHYPVLISVLEGVSLHQWLVEQHLWKKPLRDRLAAHLEQVRGIPLAMWAQAMIPCPFLEDHQCSVYRGRPVFCRTTLNMGDPYYCHPHRIGPQTNFVDRNEVSLAIETVETELLSKHKAPFLRIPLAAAVLTGAKINEGVLRLEDLGGILRDLRHGIR